MHPFFLNPGGHLSLPFLPGFVEIPGVMAVVFPYAAYQVPPFLLPAVEHATILNVSNFESLGPYQCTRMHSGKCTCFRPVALPCRVAMLGFLTSYKVPTAALCCLLTCEHSLALHAECTCPCILCISLMDELLSAIWNSSPLSHPSSCLQGLTSYFKGCPSGVVFGSC